MSSHCAVTFFPLTRLHTPWFLVCLWYSSSALATPCLSNEGAYLPYITGTGEGATLDEAKSRATEDLSGFFQTHIIARTEVAEAAESTAIDATVVTSTDRIIKGVLTLSECPLGTNVRVIVGVKKNIIKKHIEDDLMEIIKDAKQSRSDIRGLKTKLNSAASDWHLLSSMDSPLIRQANDAIEASIRLLSSKKLVITPNGSIAKATISDLVQNLQAQGMDVIQGNGGSGYSCSMAKGSAIGTMYRIAVSCKVDNLQSADISAAGICNGDDLDNCAALIVLRSLASKGG